MTTQSHTCTNEVLPSLLTAPCAACALVDMVKAQSAYQTAKARADATPNARFTAEYASQQLVREAKHAAEESLKWAGKRLDHAVRMYRLATGQPSISAQDDE